MNTNQFIEKAKKVHGDFYNYSKTDLEKRDNKNRVIVICPIHGEFLVDVSSHLRGTKCNQCARLESSSKKRKTKEYFVEKAKEIHGNKYDYSKVMYEKMANKVCIICPEHGEFWQTPLNHLNGSGCPKCGYNKISVKLKSNADEFVEKAKEIHGNKYDYSKIKYVNAHTKVCIICPEHGEFWQTPHDHLSGRGCPICNESHLEKEIRLFLTKNNIDFIYQCNSSFFKWLGKQSLDFYLPKYNIAIECQGEQHYKNREKPLFEDFRKTLNRDINKINKCVNNGVNIIYYGLTNKISNISIYNENNTFYNLNEIITFLKKYKQ